MTGVVPSSAFLKLISVLLTSSVRALYLLCDRQIVFRFWWFDLCKLDFDTFQVAFKANWLLNWWYPVWTGGGSVFFVCNMYYSRIRLANFSKSCKSWCLTLFSCVNGVGTNLNPFKIALTWLSVSWRLEGFLMNLSFDFLCVAIRFWAKCARRCLRWTLFLFEAPFRVVWFSGKRRLYFSISLLFADVRNVCVQYLFTLVEIFCNFSTLITL